MKREDVLRMAREAGDVETDSRGRETFSFDGHGLERFAKLVAAGERNACAQIVEWEAECYGEPVWAVEIIAEFRAREQK